MLSEQERNQLVFELIGNAQEGMSKAAAIQRARQQQRQEVEALIPAAINALVENRRIAPGESMKVASWLRNPVAAIQFLTEVAAHDNSFPSNNSIGRPVKTASAHTNTRQARLDAIEEEFYESMGL